MNYSSQDTKNTVDTNINDYTSIRNKIKNDLIDPTYYDDIKNGLMSRSVWKYVGDAFETLSKIFVGLSSIFAFAAGFFGYNYLSFISGCLSISSLVFLQFASYSMTESKESNDTANKILGNLGINKLENIAIQISPVTPNVASLVINKTNASINDIIDINNNNVIKNDVIKNDVIKNDVENDTTKKINTKLNYDNKASSDLSSNIST